MTPEWRVLTYYPRMPGQPFIEQAKDEASAREWAELKLQQNPHCNVVIERREVGPWDRVSGFRGLSGS